MIRTELPVPSAFRTLSDVARNMGASQHEALTFALTWLAAARMALMGNIPGVQSVTELASSEGWQAVEQSELPIPAVKRWLMTDMKNGLSMLSKAGGAVKELVSDLDEQPWDVLPTLASAALASKYESEGMVSSEVAELMLDMLGDPSQDLWIPFDRWGALTVRALRRGWTVNAAPMLGFDEGTLGLLLAIEYGRPIAERVSITVERDREGRPLTKAAFVLACPPFGMSVQGSRLAQWDSSHGETLDRNARTEHWAVYELVGRSTEKAVFLLPPGVLFSRGQELRLRENLLHRGGANNELHSVVALPGGAVSGTSLATALMVVTPGHGNDSVLMVDLGLSKRSATNIDELVSTHRQVALGLEEDSERACRVTRDDILQTEVSFAPTRYLRRTADLGPNAVPLEALCDLVRPPSIVRDENALELSELGIPELGAWQPVVGPFDKKARVKPRRDLPTLEAGDVVLSVKGSIGKAGIVGDVDPHTVALSQSCLALRLLPHQRDRVSPQYLLMFFKSEVGQAQMVSLQAGATMPHVSPQTLMSSFQVPIPAPRERERVESDFQRLCDMEREATELRERMEVIAKEHWSL